MLPYTPVPTALPGSIPQPQDVVDDVVVATVNPMVQAALNGVALRERIASQVARYAIDPGTYVDGDKLSLTPFIEGPGISYDSGTRLISIEDGGFYVGLLTALVTLDTVTPDSPAVLLLTSVGPSTSPDVATFGGMRWSATAGQAFMVNGAGGNVIDSLSTLHIEAAPGIVPDISVVSGFGVMNFFYLYRVN